MVQPTHADPLVSLPVLPLKNTVLFPYLFMPLSAGRPGSVAAVEAAVATEDKNLLVVAQKDPTVDQPGPDDLYSVGTRAVIRKLARSDSSVELLVQGLERVRILEYEQREPFLRARVVALPIPTDESTEAEALYRAILDQAAKALELMHPETPVNIQQLAAQAQDPVRLAYLLGSMLSLDVAKEQALLEAPTRLETLRLLFDYLSHEVQVLELRHKIATQAQTTMSKEQREYMLRQQLRAIQEELGEKSPERAELEELQRRLAEADLPEEVRTEAARELARLERIPPAAPDYQVTRTYLDLILELPWRKSTQDSLDLARARQVLDEDHYDLTEVKERILEHLAVMKLNPQAKAPILCFVGPPGVGKTSLGQSVARALGRRFERMSLGGLHDEAELRGHRRTYIGAMPGRIVQAIRRAGVNNPVLMLDEVDKLGRDFRGDPAAALLEILDPAQNHSFRDNYLDLPFDLSRVFFITTANTLDAIPRPLLDRMEVLRLPGYSEEEKVHIARQYLIPRQLAQAGMTAEQLQIPDETVAQIVRGYTREAGVRELERCLARIARKSSPALRRRSYPAGAGNACRPSGLPGSGALFHRKAAQAIAPRGGGGTGLDRGRRRGPVYRSRFTPRRRPAATYRPARRSHARVGQDRPELPLGPRQRVGYLLGPLPAFGVAYPCASRSGSQGRSFCRSGYRDRPSVVVQRPTGGQRDGYDRRNYAQRSGIAGGRHPRKGACRASGRYPQGHPAARQRQRLARFARPCAPGVGVRFRGSYRGGPPGCYSRPGYAGRSSPSCPLRHLASRKDSS